MPRQNIANGDIYVVRTYCWYAAGSQLAINQSTWQVDLLAGAISMQGVIDLVGVRERPLYQAILADDAEYRGSSISQRKVGGNLETPAWYRNPTPGTVAGEILPTQISAVISRQTLYGGRRGRGRIYPPFPSEASSEAGSPSAAYLIDLLDLAEYLEDDQAYSPGGGVSFSLVPGMYIQTAFIEPAFGFYDIETTVPQDAWATQRRRGVFGRPNTLPKELV